MEFIILIYSFFLRALKFKHIGSKSIIKYPFRIWNPSCITIGNGVFFAEHSFLAVNTHFLGTHYHPSLIVGDNVRIGSNVIIGCIDSVIIEDDVLMADRVFISDHTHSYKDASLPIGKQPLVTKGEVRIKKGAFIGVNAVVLPGVTIGRNSVVGASSVVTKSVPDYSVVAGNPAKVIKTYDRRRSNWARV